MLFDFKWKWLFKHMEYPARYRTGNLRKTVSIEFCVLFLFLVLYKPFGVYEPELKFNYSIICAFHALSPSLILYAYFSILNSYRKKSRLLREWTLFEEYFHIFVVLLLISIASFLMRSLIYNNQNNWSWEYFWDQVRHCYLVGSLFFFYLLLADFYFQFKITAAPLAAIDKQVHQQQGLTVNSAELFINTMVKHDNFSFNPDHLLFVKAEGNYIELTLCREKLITTELKRISLRQFESKLCYYPFLFRCHRAYIVNIRQVKKVSGNSQGYLLCFLMTENKVPVSRAQIVRFDNLLEEFGNTSDN